MIVSVAVKQVLTEVFEVVFTMDRVDEVVGGQDCVTVSRCPGEGNVGSARGP